MDVGLDVAQLTLQPSAAHLVPGVVVQGAAVQRGGDALEDRLARRAPLGGQQAAGRVEEHIDRRPLALARGPKAGRVTPAGHQLRVGVAQRIAGGEQLAHGGALGAHQLVDRPRGHGRLAQPGDLLGLLASPVAAQCLGQLTARVDEAVEREAVEVIDVHATNVARRAALHDRSEPVAAIRPACA
ncbi:MAG: hypothetical protein H0U69_06150 [Trueperaceae bacterium]|nr:hypothetical protein [Trueperaceae bacterium]